jgi:hypothetical protein
MYIDQKDELETLEKIKSEIDAGSIECIARSTNYRYIVMKIAIFEEIIYPYLRRNPLRTTKKRVSFVRFMKMVRYRITRADVPWEGKVLSRIERLIKNIKN